MGWLGSLFRRTKKFTTVVALAAALTSTVSSKPAEAYTPRTAKEVGHLNKALEAISSSHLSEASKGALIVRQLNALYKSVKLDYQLLQKKLKQTPENVSEKEIRDVLEGINLLIGLNEDLDGYSAKVRDKELEEMVAGTSKAIKQLLALKAQVNKLEATVATKRSGWFSIKKFAFKNRYEAEQAIKNQIARQLDISPKLVFNIQYNHVEWDKAKLGKKVRVFVTYRK